MKKLFACLTALFFVLSLLPACNAEGPVDTAPTETEEPEVFVSSTLIENGTSQYVIVHDGSSDTKNLANEVRNAVSKAFGVKLEVVSAKEREESGCEIVLGQSREIAQKTYKKLRGELDFALKVEENKLVLCAQDALSYQYLGEYLKRSVFVDTGDGKLVLDSEDNIVYSTSSLMEKNYVDYILEEDGNVFLEDLFQWEQY